MLAVLLTVYRLEWSGCPQKVQTMICVVTPSNWRAAKNNFWLSTFQENE
jgi:hypothetical protein